jgi:ParB family transcriptional regulator, chromosome partitioning protein
MTRRSGLGRGLAALIPPSSEQADEHGATDHDDAGAGVSDPSGPDPAPSGPEATGSEVGDPGPMGPEATGSEAGDPGPRGPEATGSESDPGASGRQMTGSEAGDPGSGVLEARHFEARHPEARYPEARYPEARHPEAGDAGFGELRTDVPDVPRSEPAREYADGEDQGASESPEIASHNTHVGPSGATGGPPDTPGGPEVPDAPDAPETGRTVDAGTTEDGAPIHHDASGAPGSSDTGSTREAPSGSDISVSPDAATLAAIAPHAIVPNPRQPRGVFDPDELDGLATSLADLGMLQPLVVRPVGDGRYELVAGERRLRAAVLAGMDTVPAVVRHTDDADLLKEALVENIHRVQLNPLEEAAAYEQLLEEFGVTQEELAARLGRSRPSISNAIRLLQLPAGVQRRVAAGVLSAGHAKALLALENADAQSRLAERIVAEGLSVRATEELVRLRLIDEPTRRGPRSRETEVPGLLELQDDLAEALQTRVRIAMGARKGKLTVEFGSVEDLERIVGVIATGLGTPVEGSIGNGASAGGEVGADSAPEVAELDEAALDARIEAATSRTPLDPGPDEGPPEA